jgi:23S rRNA (adenine2503-C2)-methyltransferase
MHVGAFTTEALQGWIQAQGASAEAARFVARTLVGRYAGRVQPLPTSPRLMKLAEAAFAEHVPEALPSPDPDGTIRFGVRYPDGALVEAVAIAHPERSTVCLSTQAGCARGCVFCETGRLGLTRNLSAAEITGQFAAVARHLAQEGRPAPTNIVFMGMGEPLDNLDAVLQATDVLSDTCGFAVAPRRITVSTVGVVPKMREFYRRARVHLAVSLHAANDEERRALLPVARSWDLAALKAAIAESPEPVLLQWTLIDGVNDTPRHVEELKAFCAGIDVRVNLIPLNPGPEEALRAPPIERVRAFQKALSDSGLRTLVRMPHGQEVGGACGQLAGLLRAHPEKKPRLPVIGRARQAGGD